MQFRAAQPTKEKQLRRMKSWLGAWREQKAKPERGWGRQGGREIWKEGKPLRGMGVQGQPRFRDGLLSQGSVEAALGGRKTGNGSENGEPAQGGSTGPWSLSSGWTHRLSHFLHAEVK